MLYLSIKMQRWNRSMSTIIKIRLKDLSLFLISIILFFLSSLSTANTETAHLLPIKIGMSTSLTGGAAQSGKNINLGVKIYFDMINATGGINGRKLKLIALDDGYEPLRAAANLHQLIDKDHVLALIGNNGTPAAVVAVPIVNESKILLFGSRSGSALLRKTPPDRYVINLRTSYFNEVNTLIKGLIASGIKPENIAFFGQKDAFGDSIHQAAVKSLQDLGYANASSLPYGRYDRNSLDVASALSHIIEHAKHPIKAFILGGVYDPNAQFIKIAKTEYPDAIYLSVSALINPDALNKNVNGQVILSQVVPDIYSDLPVAIEYREDLKKYGGKITPANTSFEGFLTAKLFVIGLKQASIENKLTREGLIDVFESMHNIDIGIGTNISFSKKDHNGLETSWITIFKDGKFVPTKWPLDQPIKNH